MLFRYTAEGSLSFDGRFLTKEDTVDMSSYPEGSYAHNFLLWAVEFGLGKTEEPPKKRARRKRVKKDA